MIELFNMIIDTHSHLNFNAFKKDLDKVIKRTLDNGIQAINVGSKYETSRRAVEIAEKYKGMYAAVGLHPIYSTGEKIKTDPEEGDFLAKEETFDYEKYKKLALSGRRRVVAIGEIGLDYYYKPKTKTRLNLFKEKQKDTFLQQLDLAEELNLPVIIHCRMAHQDLINILKQKNQIKGVIHCFTGTLEEAQEYIKLGFYIGINGIIFKMNLDEVIKNIPIEKILVETDCPYLTPPQEIGKRNEPLFIKYVIQKIADLKGIKFEEVAEKTTENAKKLFGI